ncbi:MAG: hypothetical protein WCW52_06765 [Elusimicrobiales bacterium]
MAEIDPSRENGSDAGFLALEAVPVFLVLFIPLQACLEAAKFTIFTARDLDRARLLADGSLILFGPEASGGGHLPGSFYYFLLAVPLKLGFGWKAAWELQFAFMASGFALLWLFVRRRFGAFPACYALFCAAFFNYKTLFFSYNASFIPLFAIAALISLCAAFDERSNHRGLSWAVFCLSCGLGLQFHMSFMLLLLSGLAVQLGARRIGLRPLTWKVFAAGCAVFAAVMLPYGIWAASVYFSRPIGQPALPFTGAAAVQLREILDYAVRARAGYPARALAQRTITLLPFEAIIPLALFYSGAAAAKGQAERTPDLSGGRLFAGNCVKVLSVSTALTFFTYAMSLALSPTRYSIIPRLSLDLLACAFFAARGGRLRPAVFYPAVIGGLFAFTFAWREVLWSPAYMPFTPRYVLFSAAAGFALAFLTRRKASVGARGALFFTALALPFLLASTIHPALKHYSQDDFPGSKDLETMSRIILSQTGWNYAEAGRRIFYINTREMTTPSYIYRAAAAQAVAPSPAGSGLDRIDGYFAALLMKRAPGRGNGGGKEWLLRQDIPPMLKEGLVSGGILLGVTVNCGRLFLTPYKVADPERFPPYFHNGSEGYSLTGPDPALQTAPDSRVFRLTFNDCPGHAAWCAIMADVRLRRTNGRRWLAHVVFSGEPLSQACDGVNLQWNQLLNRPYFTAVCAGTRRRVQLAGSLGLDRDEFRSMNRSLLAPYERFFHFECPGRLEKISVGYGSAAAYSMARKIEGLPGRELSVRVEGNNAPPPR